VEGWVDKMKGPEGRVTSKGNLTVFQVRAEFKEGTLKNQKPGEAVKHWYLSENPQGVISQKTTPHIS
jgi:hypothetical protein